MKYVVIQLSDTRHECGGMMGETDRLLRSVAKIECGRNEGTAICVHTSDAGGRTFLTCAHVVQHRTHAVVILRHDRRVIRGKVVYATPEHLPYDIAVIVTGDAGDLIPCRISDSVPTVGQKVIAVGYASGDRVPSTVSGCVRGMTFNVLTTTCNVCTGFSGGPVFAASDGRLLGLTVAKLSTGAVNFVLPSIEFVKTINEFNRTNDVKILNELESKCPLKKLFWNNGIPNFNICRI